MTMSTPAGSAPHSLDHPLVRARPVRAFPPAVPDEPVVLAPPPPALEPEPGRWATTVLPALSSLGIVGFALVSGSVLYVILGIGLAVLGVGAAVGMRVATTRSRRRRQEASRRRYEHHLDARHRLLSGLAERRRAGLERVHPEPARWPAVVESSALWERRPGDPDFLTVRLGLGRAPLGVPIRLEDPSPSVEEEPDLRADAEALLATHAHLDDVPLALDLAEARSVVLSGPRNKTLPLARAVLVSLALAHAPGEVEILVLGGTGDELGLAMLPHARSMGTEPAELEAFLEPLPPEGPDVPAVVVLDLDTSAPTAIWRELMERLVATAGPRLAVLLLCQSDSGPPATVRTLLELRDGCLHLRYASGQPGLLVARPDALSADAASRAALEIGAWRPETTGSSDPVGPVRLRPLLDEAPPAKRGLTVPIGRDLRGRPLTLDLAEAAQGGSGPHGIIVGATGSGKSEILRALLAGLVTRRSPRQLAIVCWDFKGGAAVEPFRVVPHVRGVVTNLESDPRAVTRAETLLRAEVRRRQHLLRTAGVDGIADYRGLADPPEALPDLVLVVDEFTELLTASPDLLDLFLTLGRLGRSLGIHLVLASQRLDEGRLRGLDSHLRFRICLRTFSAADSHAVLGSSEAYRLPSTPGSGLFAVDGAPRRFDGALVDDLDDLLAEACERWAGEPVPHARLWSPPLPESLALGSLMLDPLFTDRRTSALVAPVGLVDHPERQGVEPLLADLGGGHLAVVGAPRSGRSTLLRTLAAALATPRDAHASGPLQPPPHTYAIDGGGGSLDRLVTLQTVGGVCDVGDEDAVRQLIGDLCERVRAAPARDAGGLPRTVLLVDGWPRLRSMYEDLVEAMTELATAGPAAGVSLVLTANGWQDFRPGIREQLTTRWELRLTDPYESEHGRAKAETIPRERPGRLLTDTGHEAQVALPLTALPDTPEERDAAERTLLVELAAESAHRFSPPTPIPSLPSVVTLDELPSDPPASLVLGSDGSATAVLDSSGPGAHLVVVGTAGSGRSTTLASLLTQLDPSRADVDLWVLDPRRSLLPSCAALGTETLDGYAYTAAGASRLLDGLAARLRRRLPADDLPLDQLLRPTAVPRRQVLVVDDYDLLGSVPGGYGGAGFGGHGGLGPLAELLPFSDQIALTLIVARRGGGAIRAGYDTGWQSLLDLGATGLLLAGDPGDGPVLRGVRARPQPPGRGLLVRPGRPTRPIQVALPRRPGTPTREGGETLHDLRTFGRNRAAL